MDEHTNPIVDMFRASIGRKLEGGPPFTEWLDGRIVSCGVGELEMTFKVRPEMSNPTGLLHGGIQAAIISELHPADVIADGFCGPTRNGGDEHCEVCFAAS